MKVELFGYGIIGLHINHQSLFLYINKVDISLYMQEGRVILTYISL